MADEKEKKWLRHFRSPPPEPPPSAPRPAHAERPAAGAPSLPAAPQLRSPTAAPQTAKSIASNGQEEGPMADLKSTSAKPQAAPARTPPAPPKLRYEDRNDLFETFADSVGPWSFDGQTLRFEFTVTRLDPNQEGKPPSGRRIPTVRLALTVGGAMELINHCRQLALALEKAGLVKQAPTAPAAPGKPS